jgi:plastocyanin
MTGVDAGAELTRGQRRLALGICMLFVAVQVAGCFSERVDAIAPPNGQTCNIPVSALGPGKAVVAIRGYQFFPDTLRVRAGTTVTWVNCDDLAGALDPHTSTSDTGIWSSQLFKEGETFERAFGATGPFAYHCQPHTNMRGVIIVQ